MSPLITQPHPETSLAELYPKETINMYGTCQDGALKHTGKDSLFGSLKTNPEAIRLQHVDIQFVEQTTTRIEEVMEFGEALSPGISAGGEDFLSQHEDQVEDAYNVLKAGQNVIITVPTHSAVHDIVFPMAQLAMALKTKYGYDQPKDRYQIFAKSLAWYNYAGTPVPEVGRMLANTVFTLPHSRSGDQYDNKLQDEFNARALHQLWDGLNQGGKLMVLATGGATNLKRSFGENRTAECQGAIHEGTARLMTNDRNLVLPAACYIDSGRAVTTRLGQVRKLDTEYQCFQVGVWAARQYQEMSGHLTIQAPTRDQAEHFLRAKAEDLEEVIKNSKTFLWAIAKRMLSSEQPN